jgi:hypothetical protein
MVLRRIGVMSAAKVIGALYAVLGLVMGLVFAAVFSLIGAAGPAADPDIPSWLAPMFGVGSIIFMPIFYGIMGFIMGAIGAAVYNLFAGMVGGVELDLQPGLKT